MRINIARYPVFMKLGYFHGERVRGQEVLVSLSVDLVHDPAGIDDILEKTADYGKILAVLDQTLQDQEMNLIETAVERAGKALLQHFRNIVAVELSVEKPQIPNGLGRGAQVSVSEIFHREKA